MKALLGNLLIALAWVVLSGDGSMANLLLGFLVGFATLALLGDAVGARTWRRRWIALVVLSATFLWELLVSNARLVHDVVTPGLRARPALVGVDLEGASSDTEILLISILVTLTPGSVVVHVTPDRRRIYVYDMYADDPDLLRRRTCAVFVRRVRAVTRGEAAP